MSKKTISLLLLFVSCGVLLFVCLQGDGQQCLSQLYVSEEEYQQIISQRNMWVPEYFDNNHIADEIYFNGYALPYDDMEHMLLYSLVEDDPKAYDPVVNVVCYREKVHMALWGDRIDDQFISNSGSIHLVLYTDDFYQEYILQCTTLPILEVDVSGLKIGDEDIQVELRLFDNRAETVNRQIETSAFIHMRGNNSKMYPKNDYRISLRTLSLGNNWRNYPLSLLGMRQDDDWIIKGQYNDTTKTREVFSTRLWYETANAHQEYEMVNGIEYRYVEVFMGGYYWGLYALGHPIDAKQMQLKAGEQLYKKGNANSELLLDYHSQAALYPDRELYPLENAYVIEGGEPPSYEPLIHYYDVLLTTIAEDRHAIYQIADTENSIDMYLFLNLIQGIDHVKVTRGLYNMFLCAKYDAQGQMRMLYVPWDMDRTWGLDFGDSLHMDPALNVEMTTNMVVQLEALGDTDISRLVCQRYRTLRQTIWSEENVTELLLSCQEDIFASGAYERDFERWYMFLPDEHMPPRYPDLTEFIQYVHQRLFCLDEYMEQKYPGETFH